MPTFLAPAAVATTNNYATYGTAPAGSGTIRLSNGAAQAITWRNVANNNDIQALYVTSSDDLWCNTGSGKNLYMAHGGAAIAQFSSAGLTFNPGFNITTYGAGFKIASTTGEKISFWGATPISQPANTVAIDDLLVNTGLRASGGISNFTNSIAIGSIPANQGAIRLPNAQYLYWRNATNTGDIAALQVGADNNTWMFAAAGQTAGFAQAGGGAWFTASGSGTTATGFMSATGLSGATAASRLVGATTSGAPTTGTFAKGDVAIDQTGRLWVNTTAGSPGTWTNAATTGGYWSNAKWGVD